MEDYKLVCSENLIANSTFFGAFELWISQWREQNQCFLIQNSSTTKVLHIENLMNEIRLNNHEETVSATRDECKLIVM